MPSEAELICKRREAREGGLAFWIHKDWLECLVETKRELDLETQSDKFYKDLKKVYTRLYRSGIRRSSSAETSTPLWDALQTIFHLWVDTELVKEVITVIGW
uniref:Uncharacterized protein n=1 Tax=Caenorhabditis japonica TaxID=281687 RepID=A0A8R1I4J3_CAEJA